MADVPDDVNHGARRRPWLGSLLTLITGGLAIASLAYLIDNRQAAAAIDAAARQSAEALNASMAPLLAGLPANGPLPPETKSAIEAVLSKTPAGRDVVTLKIWDSAGRVVHSNRKWLDARVFPITPNLAKALKGTVVGDIGGLDDEENESEQAVGIPLLEVYAPIRKSGSEPVTAVAEYYSKASALDARLKARRFQIWTIAGLAFAGIAALAVAFAWLRSRRV